MAEIVLILGESGTGKSTSLRNFKEDEIALVNIAGKKLPFRKQFKTVLNSKDTIDIKNFLKKCEEKIIVIDDFQYKLAFAYMNRLLESGWDKYNEIQSEYFQIIETAKKLPDDKIVFFLSHIETKDDGHVKIKTIGKMLDEKITIEGLFTIVLRTFLSEGKYFFTTQNSGNDTVKSPLEMFPNRYIDNDLKYVVEKIRNYYSMDNAISDDEMQKADEAVKVEVKERKRRKLRDEISPVEEVKPQVDTQVEVKSENRPRRRNRKSETENIEVPF